MIKLGRISYVNMAPVFHSLEYEVEEVVGVPTELNRMLLDGAARCCADLLDRVRAPCRHAAAPAAPVRLVGGCGRLDPARHAHGARTRALGRRHARERHVGRADPDPASRRRDPLLRGGGRRQAADRRCRAPRARSRIRRLTTTSAVSGSRRRGCRWCSPSGRLRSRSSKDSPISSTRSSRRCVSPAPSPRSSPTRRASATATRPGFLARYFEKLRYSFGPRERAGFYTFLEMARDVGELHHVPELRFARDAELPL